MFSKFSDEHPHLFYRGVPPPLPAGLTPLTQLYILKEWIFNWKSKKMQNTFILSPRPHMFCHFVPVIFVHF